MRKSCPRPKVGPIPLQLYIATPCLPSFTAILNALPFPFLSENRNASSLEIYPVWDENSNTSHHGADWTTQYPTMRSENELSSNPGQNRFPRETLPDARSWRHTSLVINFYAYIWSMWWLLEMLLPWWKIQGLGVGIGFVYQDNLEANHGISLYLLATGGQFPLSALWQAEGRGDNKVRGGDFLCFANASLCGASWDP